MRPCAALHRGSAAVAAAFLALPLVASGLGAQEGSPDVPPGLELLSPGDRLRVTSSSVRLDGATFLGFRDEALRVREDAEEIRVPMRELRSVQVENRATGEGAWKGALIGGAIGAAWGIIVDGAECPTPSTCTNQYWPAVPRDGAIGLGVGALVGAGVGFLLRDWRQVFP